MGVGDICSSRDLEFNARVTRGGRRGKSEGEKGQNFSTNIRIFGARPIFAQAASIPPNGSSSRTPASVATSTLTLPRTKTTNFWCPEVEAAARAATLASVLQFVSEGGTIL